jgi:RNA polymerase subunit RPABC4/transcription elongation factor Spt4
MEALIARAVQVLIALGGAYILTLWFAIVVWTFQDIQARSRSVVAQIFSTLVVLIFSIPGLLIYMVLRPRYTLDDAFQRSLEEEYLMQDLEELPLCPGCQQYVEDEWVFCPNCRTELRDNCIACDQLIDLRWEICPFCGTEQYEDEGASLPQPVLQPLMTPSPQFLGRPQLTQTQVQQLASVQEDRTRPIIPATVRVDLRSGNIATEDVPQLPVSSRYRALGDLVQTRRVSIEGNGRSAEDEVSPDWRSESVVDVTNGANESATGRETVDESEHPPEMTDRDYGAPAGEPIGQTKTDNMSAEEQPSSESAGSGVDGSHSGEAKRQRKRRSRRKKSSTRTSRKTENGVTD